MATTRDAVAALAAAGFKPLPVRPGKKSPYVEWTEYRDKPTWPALASEWRNSTNGVWSLMGSLVGWVVLDCDNQAAEDLWHERIEYLDQVPRVKTRKGHHYYFRVGEVWQGWTWQSDPEAKERGANYEILGDGQGVMMPPSTHADDPGFQYAWEREVIDCEEFFAPSDLAKPTVSSGNPLGEGVARSMLASLLEHPAPVGGQHNWLVKVCGHLAKMVKFKDAYDALVHLAGNATSPPMDPEDILKTGESVWQSEQKAVSDRPTDDSGWLVTWHGVIHTQVKVGDAIALVPWADFDLECTGVVDSDTGRSYSVRIRRASGQDTVDLVPAGLLGRPAELNGWLSARHAVVLPPKGETNPGPFGPRLQRYLESQKAPSYVAAESLGWHEGIGFVTHEGVITVAGLVPHAGVIPHPRLTGWAPYRYGQAPGGPAEARAVLREVLTFHDETVAAVFGAWWAACFLKEQIQANTALFPFMALEAPSESGKTTGFFALMAQLAGNHEGHGEYTAPVLRDRASAHRNGPVWIDDVTDPDKTLDLLRQATSGGSRSKKGADRTTQETVTLRAPMVISGEGLGALGSEKALLDRAVRLAVPPPTGRRSARDASRPQWDDVVDLSARYRGDLTIVAGTLVQMALGSVERVAELRALRAGSGRYADKVAILRVGARILADLTDDPTWVTRVDGWCLDQEDTGQENVLTREMLPWALTQRWMEGQDTHGWPTTPSGGPPVYVDKEGLVWWSEERLANVWSLRRDLTGRQKQLGSIDSIRLQRQALGIQGVGTRKKIGSDPRTNNPKQVRYQSLTEALSLSVCKRAGSDGMPDTPVYPVSPVSETHSEF